MPTSVGDCYAARSGQGEYEQLSAKPDSENDVFTTPKPPPRAKWSDICVQKSFMSLGLILLYFSLSIGLTFYQRWLLQDFSYPLTVVMYHLVVKWVLSVIIRTILCFITGVPPLVLPFKTCLRAVCPTGIASGIDVGFSNWGLKLVTISLYTMTKSTTIIFILGFAILLGLEKKSWSLVGIVLTIAAGIIMFTYKATQFNIHGFNLLLLASLAAGFRWTFTQVLMQRSKPGLHNPLDMVFHVQPWMFLSLMPFAALFEGNDCFAYLSSLPTEELGPTILKVSVGATIAFAMEISEFLVVTYTSSLTLSIAGLFKEMCILILAVEVKGDQLSLINVIGLTFVLLGISCHVIHKVIVIKSIAGSISALDETEDFDAQPLRTRSPKKGQHHEPLLSSQDKWPLEMVSEESDNDTNSILDEILNRRDGNR